MSDRSDQPKRSDLDDLTRECERLAGYPMGETLEDEVKRLRKQNLELLSERKKLLDYITAFRSVKQMLEVRGE